MNSTWPLRENCVFIPLPFALFFSPPPKKPFADSLGTAGWLLACRPACVNQSENGAASTFGLAVPRCIFPTCRMTDLVVKSIITRPSVVACPANICLSAATLVAFGDCCLPAIFSYVDIYGYVNSQRSKVLCSKQLTIQQNPRFHLHLWKCSEGPDAWCPPSYKTRCLAHHVDFLRWVFFSLWHQAVLCRATRQPALSASL